MAGAEQGSAECVKAQVAGGRATAKVFDLRVAAIVDPGLELEACRVLRVDFDMLAVQPFSLQSVEYKAAKGVRADTA